MHTHMYVCMYVCMYHYVCMYLLHTSNVCNIESPTHVWCQYQCSFPRTSSMYRSYLCIYLLSLPLHGGIQEITPLNYSWNQWLFMQLLPHSLPHHQHHSYLHTVQVMWLQPPGQTDTGKHENMHNTYIQTQHISASYAQTYIHTVWLSHTPAPAQTQLILDHQDGGTYICSSYDHSPVQ